MTNGTSVMQRCISLAGGALSPDIRVNYEFGLVLGVDEFRQEQMYHLEKNYLHHRTLHGYGRVSGLVVGIAQPEGATDYQVSVSPGTGVDQIGRPFVVRTTQCAFLGAWLDRQNPDALPQPDESGVRSVYVVATYDECLDALVTVAGQPCASSDQTQVPSRIRDSVNIQIRTTPPDMHAWDTVRRFAVLMSDVDIVDNLTAAEAAADEADLAALIRVLDDGDLFWQQYNAGLETGETRRQFRLPGENSREALDRLFRIWVSEVRPRLRPDLLDPAGATTQPPETAILLARIDFMAEETDGGWIVVPSEDGDLPAVTDEGTPFLLHTQLIQELLLLGGSSLELPDIREFVTFDNLISNATPPVINLRMWFHADHPITFLDRPGRTDPAVVLMRGIDRTVIQTISLKPGENVPDGPAHVWELSPSRARLNEGDLLTLRFDTDQIGVGLDGRRPVTLTAYMQQTGISFVGYDGDHHIEVYHLIDLPPVPASQPGGVTIEEVMELLNRVRTVPFVTVSLVTSNQDTEAIYELWFHLDVVGDHLEFALTKPNVRAFAEIDNKIFELPLEILTQTAMNTWQVRVGITDAPGPQPEQHAYLRFVFALDENIIMLPSGEEVSLRDYIKQFEAKLDGFFSKMDDGQDSVVVYYRFPFFKERG
jgi:hypothetical protein